MAHTSQPHPDRARRLLLGGGLAAMAAGVSMVPASRAVAAPATAAWLAGGNTNITTDGTNYLGTRNVAPLVFKTAATANTPLERMRILSNGRIGIGTVTPAARFDVISTTSLGVQGTNTATTAGVSGVSGVVRSTAPGADSAGVRGVNNGTSFNGSGVAGSHAGTGYGVFGTSVNGYGVYGTGDYAGLYGTASSYGVVGTASSGYGVYGSGDIGVYASGSSYGVRAFGSSYGVYGNGPYGVYGAGGTFGVYGTGTYGVYGTSSTASGVYGVSSEPNSAAVYGSGGQYGVRGVNGRTGGVRGDSGYVGVWGSTSGTNGFAVYGEATATSGTTYAVFGTNASAAGYAGYFAGNTRVTGTLTKAAGSFKIDHPQDPDGKWLSHSFVESPDMLNIYNGNVVLDAAGEATVPLPTYFTALNKDYRYQLTCIGGPGAVYIAQKVTKNAFKIAGGTAGLEVSWQVTGIRQDDYANAHRIPVESPKTKAEAGTRQFVPAGSSATPMSFTPPAPADKQPTPPSVSGDEPAPAAAPRAALR